MDARYQNKQLEEEKASLQQMILAKKQNPIKIYIDTAQNILNTKKTSGNLKDISLIKRALESLGVRGLSSHDDQRSITQKLDLENPKTIIKNSELKNLQSIDVEPDIVDKIINIITGFNIEKSNGEIITIFPIPRTEEVETITGCFYPITVGGLEGNYQVDAKQLTSSEMDDLLKKYEAKRLQRFMVLFEKKYPQLMKKIKDNLINPQDPYREVVQQKNVYQGPQKTILKTQHMDPRARVRELLRDRFRIYIDYYENFLPSHETNVSFNVLDASNVLDQLHIGYSFNGNNMGGYKHRVLGLAFLDVEKEDVDEIVHKLSGAKVYVSEINTYYTILPIPITRELVDVDIFDPITAQVVEQHLGMDPNLVDEAIVKTAVDAITKQRELRFLKHFAEIYPELAKELNDFPIKTDVLGGGLTRCIFCKKQYREW